MSKLLVLCCDGTWNSHDSPHATNVLKMRDLVLPASADGRRQAVYYDPGVGSAGGWLRRAFDGATGRGLSENIRQAYLALVDNYEPGDSIYLFGFSRGAYTVRSLAGFIRKCGILKHERRDRVGTAYRFYGRRGASNAPATEAARAFRAGHAVADRTPIHFMGVWDTVGALGNPRIRHGYVARKLRFHDCKLSSSVAHAYQALAIDEVRRHFRPAVWEQQEHAAGQVMEQAWFIGAHSDVGGGYPDGRLSRLALRWIALKAAAQGLALDRERLEALAAPQARPWMTIAHDSHRGVYRLYRALFRSIADPAAADAAVRTNERLHWTVIERFRQDLGYRPANLVAYLRRNPRLLEGDPRRHPELASP
jgi:uncharacterized protein (DUF2235 family)